jgi:hypothetical protein
MSFSEAARSIDLCRLKIQESITQQLKTHRVQCPEENKFSKSNIVDISRTFPWWSIRPDLHPAVL